MSEFIEYDRNSAIAYARQWAHSRNPNYYDYEYIGGDCTNFVSQCLLAGNAVMNYTRNEGWYYIDGNRKAPAWTGVEYLFRFLTRKTESTGPVGKLCYKEDVSAGDIVQLSFDGTSFDHTLIIVYMGEKKSVDDILVAAHTYDAYLIPLSTYSYRKVRFIEIEGIRIN